MRKASNPVLKLYQVSGTLSETGVSAAAFSPLSVQVVVPDTRMVRNQFLQASSAEQISAQSAYESTATGEPRAVAPT